MSLAQGAGGLHRAAGPGYMTAVPRLLDLVRGRWVAVTLGVLAVALLASAVTGRRGFVRLLALEEELTLASGRNFQLVQSINRLRHQLHDIRTDDAALERLARRRLRFLRDGETLYRLAPRDGISGRVERLAEPGSGSNGSQAKSSPAGRAR